ncbi:MAG: hypothetical protein JSV12_06160 [Candidatus Bathyarchaeota archaeon]|nr:MAG: hypothetical protein JSV12_06160 [Candidatus Bathyarchaeota archaeon]
MLEIENPTATLVRLLDKNMRVVKEDGSLANVHVSAEWYDRELLRHYDGQVTVGLDRSEDQKLGFSATSRRRVGYSRINIWVIDKPGSVVGRELRNKLREEVNRIIREKRTKPNETNYDFLGVGQTTETHKAYHAESASELVPGDAEWTELTNMEYEKLWYSDDDRFSHSTSVNLNYALLLFQFKVDPDEKIVKKIVLKFERYGTAPTGNGFTIKVWNFTASAWQNAQAGTGGEDETVTITLTSSLTDFIDVDGYVYLLARTINASDGATAAVIYCDYSECGVTVEGITYADIVSYRDRDEVRVKPFLWRTEFTVKTWLFENVTVM